MYRCIEHTHKSARGSVRLPGGGIVSAARAAWIRAHGPTKLHVLHRCDNPRCVRLGHLFLGTNLDNVKDRMTKGRKSGPKPKVSRREVVRLRAKGWTFRRLAAKFGVGLATIQRAVKR